MVTNSLENQGTPSGAIFSAFWSVLERPRSTMTQMRKLRRPGLIGPQRRPPLSDAEAEIRRCITYRRYAGLPSTNPVSACERCYANMANSRSI